MSIKSKNTIFSLIILALFALAFALSSYSNSDLYADKNSVNNLYARLVEEKLADKYNQEFNAVSVDVNNEIATGVFSDGTNSFGVTYNTKQDLLIDSYNKALSINKAQKTLKDRAAEYGSFHGSKAEIIDGDNVIYNIGLSVDDIRKFYAFYIKNEDLLCEDIVYLVYINDATLNVKQSDHLTLTKLQNLLEREILAENE